MFAGESMLRLTKSLGDLGSFNEAPACLPGKGGPGAWFAGGTSGFNEAPACLPGKAVEEEISIRRENEASMRPRHVCRGKISTQWWPVESSATLQ